MKYFIENILNRIKTYIDYYTYYNKHYKNQKIGHYIIVIKTIRVIIESI